MSSLAKAMRYPTERDDWIRTVIIGGVLSLFGFLLFPILPVYGYVVRVIRDSLAGEREPPRFDEWGELFVDGIQAFLIGVAYMLVPAVVGLVFVGGSIAAVARGTEGGAAAGAAGFVVGLLVTTVLTLVFGYAAVAGIVNFAREDRFGAAFDVDVLQDVLFDGDYAVAWLLSVAVFVAAGVVTGILNAIPLLGAVLGAFVFFYGQVVAANLWAGGFGDALGTEPDDDAGRARVEESAV